ncbi:MAG: glycosyltransferase family 4 protein [Fusobacteriaceae bacterium]
MNILHLLPTDQFGGGEKVALQLMKYDKINKMKVACGKGTKEIFEKIGVEAYSLNIKNIFETCNLIREIVKEDNIDIIHAHDNRMSIFAFMSTRFFFDKEVKIVSHIHNMYPWLKKNGIYRGIDYLFRNRYDFNIYCGKDVEAYYLEYGGYIDFKKTSPISNGIEKIECNGRLTKKELGLEGKFVFGFVGRLTEQKGLEPFIKELSKQRDKFKDSKFLIIGSGDREEKIKMLTKTEGVDDLFKFIGFKEDIYSYFDCIDLFFLPSLYEGLPMTLLEAMSYGKIAVATDVGSIREVIIEGETGILVSEPWYPSFINKLLEIKDNPILMGEMEKNAKNLVSKKCDISFQVEKVNDIYKKLKE